jgi:iron uptake system component EfeO
VVERRPPVTTPGIVLSFLLVPFLGLVSCASDSAHNATATSASAAAAAAKTRIEVSVGTCGKGWSAPRPGQQHFSLVNTDTRAGEVLLTDAKSGAVYAEIEPVGSGTSADLTIALGSGQYAFRCAMEDEATITGPTVTIPGSVPKPVAPVLAVTEADLVPYTKAYEDYVRGQIPSLVALTTTLHSALTAGNLAAARQAWLPAHVEYERLGAAYGAFGDLDGNINGLPNGLRRGIHDPDWEGFHRIEYGLWHGETAASLLPHATELLSSTQQLGAAFRGEEVDPLELSIRAHEITENALQFELTGQTDYGSASNLATVNANLEGTKTVLGIIRPLLVPRYAQLSALTTQLATSSADVQALGHSASWPPLAALNTPQRERVNADLSQLSELLAPVATILEPRRPR